MIKISRRTVNNFLKVAKPFFVSEQKWKAVGLLLLIACLSLSTSGLNVIRSFIDRDFFEALKDRESEQFLQQLWHYALLFSFFLPTVVYYRYCEERFALFWRGWLSEKIITAYLSKRAYYAIAIGKQIDNPDQRIEEDIRTFTVSSLSFALILFNSVLALFAFMGILWSISPFLTIGALLYALFGSIITYFLGRPLVDLQFSQLKREGDYRYKLINIRDNAEAVAFYHGETEERTGTLSRLSDALNNMRIIIDRYKILGFFTNSYNFWQVILPTIIVSPLYFTGDIKFGQIVQAGGAFGQVLGALSIVVIHFGGLSSLAAVSNRLGPFLKLIENPEQTVNTEKRIVIRPGRQLIFEDVTILTPNMDQALVQNLSFELEPEERLLISGPSGSGKSSVLRAISGLWQQGNGTITRPDLNAAMFIPQRPYMVLGSLREQFFYGTRINMSSYDNAQILKLLKLMDFNETFERVGGFDARLDWANVLSLGEQQQIAFARVFIAKPKIVFLDEAITSLDEDKKNLYYKLLQESGAHYVSVGLRSDLDMYHNVVLTLGNNWRLERLWR